MGQRTAGRRRASSRVGRVGPGSLGARLLTVLLVPIIGLLNGFFYGRFGNFMKHNSIGFFRVQTKHFTEVTGNGFTFAVFIGSEPNCVSCFNGRF